MAAIFLGVPRWPGTMRGTNLSTAWATMATPEQNGRGNWLARQWPAFLVVAVAAILCWFWYEYEMHRIHADRERDRDANLIGNDGARGVRVK